MPAGSTFRIIADQLQIAALATGVGGAKAAYHGRPKEIAPSDAEQKLEADLAGEPAPITPAKEADAVESVAAAPIAPVVSDEITIEDLPRGNDPPQLGGAHVATVSSGPSVDLSDKA